VISRYQEDISWANGVPNCIIYNKSDSQPNTIHPLIQLPNVGREGHTYLHHIITNYDRLDDYTVFLQGYPFDHSPKLEHKLKLYSNKINQNEMISFEYLSDNILNIQIIPLSDYHLLPCYYVLFGSKKSSEVVQNKKTITFGAGAQFIVSKETILSRPKEFYEKMIKLLDYDINPIEGHSVERLWHTVFTHSE